MVFHDDDGGVGDVSMMLLITNTSSYPFSSAEIRYLYIHYNHNQNTWSTSV